MALVVAQRRHGLTLIEALVATAVLAAAVTAIATSLTAGHMQGGAAVSGRRAMTLAGELMEYALTLPYFDPDGPSEPGPELGELSLAMFDNLDDLHGYTEPAGELKDMAGVAHGPEYQVYTREVTAEYGVQELESLNATVAGLTITVSVSDEKGRTWRMSRFVPQPTE